jgi:hypothetical protein
MLTVLIGNWKGRHHAVDLDVNGPLLLCSLNRVWGRGLGVFDLA